MPQFLFPATHVTALALALRRYSRLLEQAATEIVTPGEASGGAAQALEEERKLVADWLGKLRPGHEFPHDQFDAPTIRLFRRLLEGLKQELQTLSERLGTYTGGGEVKLWGAQETLKKIDDALQGVHLGVPGEGTPPSAPGSAAPPAPNS
ncbi:MAG: hypothetical protein ACRDHY_03740 [Anaerolineales bacterium]